MILASKHFLEFILHALHVLHGLFFICLSSWVAEVIVCSTCVRRELETGRSHHEGHEGHEDSEKKRLFFVQEHDARGSRVDMGSSVLYFLKIEDFWVEKTGFSIFARLA